MRQEQSDLPPNLFLIDTSYRNRLTVGQPVKPLRSFMSIEVSSISFLLKIGFFLVGLGILFIVLAITFSQNRGVFILFMSMGLIAIGAFLFNVFKELRSQRIIHKGTVILGKITFAEYKSAAVGGRGGGAVTRWIEISYLVKEPVYVSGTSKKTVPYFDVEQVPLRVGTPVAICYLDINNHLML